MSAVGTQLWSSGPANFYVGIPGQSPGAALFVGTCKEKPLIEIDFLFKPAMNDLAGGKPLDKMYVGRSGMVTADLNKFNFPIIQALCSPPNFAAALAAVAGLANGAAAPGGTDFPGDVGTLCITEGQNFVLYVVFPYFGGFGVQKPAYAGAVPGYRFVGAMTNKETLAEVGTAEPFAKRLIFDCERVPYAVTNTGYGTTALMLYDHAVAGLPSPN